MRRSVPILFLAIVTAAGIACGGGAPEPVVPPPIPSAEPSAPASAAPSAEASASPSALPSAAPSAAPTAEGPKSFDSMSMAEKAEHMKKVVAPKMGKVFQDYDGKRYEAFGCVTCHGKAKEDPHKVLPKLTLSGDGMKNLTAKKPKIMKFMQEKVTPEMAAAMGEKPYDPATKSGFGCGGCHTVN
jgi:hypothetical protein